MDSVQADMTARPTAGRCLTTVYLILATAIAVGGGLLPQPALAGLVPQDSEQRIELLYWESIQDSSRSEDYEAYLEDYPDGRFASLARRRAQYLRAQPENTETPPTRAADAQETARPTENELADERPRLESVGGPYVLLETSNVRSSPSGSATVSGVLTKGQVVKIKGRVVDRNWYQLDAGNGVSGYIYGDLVEAVAEIDGEDIAEPTDPQNAAPREATPLRPGPRVVEMSGEFELLETSNLRDFPSASAPVIAVLVRGQTITVSGQVAKQNWYQLTLPDGRQGYIYGELVRQMPVANPYLE